MRSLVAAALALAALAPAGRASGQVADSVPPRAGFVGKIRSSLDSSGVRSADIRLMFVDSAKKVSSKSGVDSLEVFVDTARSRIGVTDSVGNFSVRQLRAGHYLMEVRRIGFAPLSGVLSVDSTVLSTVLTMDVVSRLLSTVKVTAVANDRVKERLDRVGFLNRYRSAGSGTFVNRADILRRKPLTVADILSAYGIHGQAEFIMDRMPGRLRPPARLSGRPRHRRRDLPPQSADGIQRHPAWSDDHVLGRDGESDDAASADLDVHPLSGSVWRAPFAESPSRRATPFSCIPAPLNFWYG